MSHVHAFPMHTYSLFNILVIFEKCWDFFDCLSLSLSFRLCYSCLWHLNESLLRLGTLFVLGHPLPLILLLHIFGSVMRMPVRPSQRTFLDKAFILNAESFWRTSLTLTYPMSFTVGVGSHCVTFQSHVHSC